VVRQGRPLPTRCRHLLRRQGLLLRLAPATAILRGGCWRAPRLPARHRERRPHRRQRCPGGRLPRCLRLPPQIRQRLLRVAVLRQRPATRMRGRRQQGWRCRRHPPRKCQSCGPSPAGVAACPPGWIAGALTPQAPSRRWPGRLPLRRGGLACCGRPLPRWRRQHRCQRPPRRTAAVQLPRRHRGQRASWRRGGHHGHARWQRRLSQSRERLCSAQPRSRCR